MFVAKKKKVLTLLLSVMLLALCACGNSKKDLVGTWQTTMDYSEMMKAGLGEDFKDYQPDFKLKLNFTLSEDNTFTMTIDEEDAKEKYKLLFDDIIDMAVERIYEEASAMNLDSTQTDEVFQTTYGMSPREYLTAEFEKNANIDDFSSASFSGIYQVKKDRLYTDETTIQKDKYDLFTVSGSILTLNAPNEASAENFAKEFPGLSYPIVFTKIK